MPPTDPWSFGLNQLLTVIGMMITLGIAGLGFRSFGKWKREKLEERRIDLALEALALAYETQYVFDGIRSPMSYDAEWADMKGVDDPERRRAAGPYFAILNRVDANKEFFQRVWHLQPRYLAMFGKEAAEIFKELHQSRRHIEVSAGMLFRAAAQNDPIGDPQFRHQLESDIWGMLEELERINPKLAKFADGIENHCMPVVRLKFRQR